MVVSDADVYSGFLAPVLTQILTNQLLFSHASAEVRGENMLERNFASIGFRTHNHHVMSLTCSPLSHLGRGNTPLCFFSDYLTKYSIVYIQNQNIIYVLHCLVLVCAVHKSKFKNRWAFEG